MYLDIVYKQHDTAVLLLPRVHVPIRPLQTWNDKNLWRPYQNSSVISYLYKTVMIYVLNQYVALFEFNIRGKLCLFLDKLFQFHVCLKKCVTLSGWRRPVFSMLSDIYVTVVKTPKVWTIDVKNDRHANFFRMDIFF